MSTRRDFIKSSVALGGALAIGQQTLEAQDERTSAKDFRGTLKPKTLLVATYEAFAPVCSKKDGRAIGRDIDFLRLFAKTHGLKIKFNFYAFNNIWKLPGTDTCDLAAAGIAPLKSRDSKGCTWSKPYFEVNRSLLIRAADKKELKTMRDFEGKRIAVTKGSTADIDTVMRKPKSAVVVYYDNQPKAVQDLLDGRIDAFGEGDVSNQYLADQNPGKFALADVHPMDPVETFAVSVRDKSGILEPLNRFIEANRDKY